MPEATAKLRHLRIAPRKVRLVANLIRGKTVAQARGILTFTLKRSAEPLLKLLNSAAANMENAARERRERIDTDEMIIKEITVGPGRTLHRWISAPRGRAVPIRKRSSHVHIVISDSKK